MTALKYNYSSTSGIHIRGKSPVFFNQSRNLCYLNTGSDYWGIDPNNNGARFSPGAPYHKTLPFLHSPAIMHLCQLPNLRYGISITVDCRDHNQQRNSKVRQQIINMQLYSISL